MLERSESRTRASRLVVGIVAACALLPLQLGARPTPAPEAEPVSQAPERAAAVVAAPPVERSRADRAPREVVKAPAPRAVAVQQAPADQEAVTLADRDREERRRSLDEAATMLQMMRKVAEERGNRTSQDDAVAQAVAELAGKTAALQTELEGRSRVQSQEVRRQTTEELLRQQLEQLQTQQQELLRQIAQISEYQKALEEAQRRFADEAAKLRLELRAR